MQKFIAIGNVGKDPEVKEFDNGGKIANFSLATTERGFTTRDGKVIEDKTTWHNISVSGGLAGVVEQYVRQGDKLFIEGKINNRSYKTQDGETRYITEVKVDQLEMLGNGGSNTGHKSAPKQQQQPRQGQSVQKDDLPF